MLIKDPLRLIRKSTWSSSGFSLLFEWSFTICQMPYVWPHWHKKQFGHKNNLTAHDYYLLKKLIRKREDGEQNPIYFVTIEEMFDAIKQVHINTGHRGRDKMIKETSKKFANITHESLNLFKMLFVQCQRKRKRVTTKGVVVTPIISRNRFDVWATSLFSMDDFCSDKLFLVPASAPRLV